MMTVLISWGQIHDDISQKKENHLLKASPQRQHKCTEVTCSLCLFTNYWQDFFLMLKEVFAVLFGLNKDESTPSLT